MYNETVMAKFKNPTNVGEIPDADGVGVVGSPACGDIMKMYLKISEDVIIDAKFQTFGCAAAIASSSMAIEMIKGKTLDFALNLKNSDVVNALGGLPAQKIHCSVMAEEAIKAAIEDYKNKK